MKLGPVTKPDKRSKKKNVKKNNDEPISEKCDVVAFFEFTVNSEQSISLIPDAFMFLLK